jgi:acetolactate synthase small subunit
LPRLVLRCLASEQPHTLTRIVGLCAGRACVIESVSARRNAAPGVMAITLVVTADTRRAAKLAGQLARLVDVLSVTPGDIVTPGDPAGQDSALPSISTVSRPTSDSSRYGA